MPVLPSRYTLQYHGPQRDCGAVAPAHAGLLWGRQGHNDDGANQSHVLNIQGVLTPNYLPAFFLRGLKMPS